MLNIFRSPKKELSSSTTSTIAEQQNNLLVKQFNGLNIQVYGTFEEPLFKAKDIGELLEIKNIYSSTSKFSNKDKRLHSMETLGGLQELLFLTESGVYTIIENRNNNRKLR